MKKLNLLKSNSIYLDIILNIIASLLLTFATQIIAFPITSRIVSIHEYGNILTIVAIMNLLAVTLGNSLNNSRLLAQEDRAVLKIEPNFNFIFILCLLINFLFVTITLLNLFNLSFLSLIALSISSCALLVRSYYIVEYRLKINFKKILLISCLSVIGYFLGALVSFITKIWFFTFVVGEIIPVIYLLTSSKLLKFGLVYNRDLYKDFSNFTYLCIAAFFITFISYLDRFIINPLIGANFVSIFVVSSFLGKIVGILLGPIAGVLLSYYVKESKMTLNAFYKRLAIYLSVSLIFYILILLIGKSIVEILYPTLVKYIDPYFALANLGAIIYTFGNLVQPTFLVYNRAYMSSIVQGTYFIIYLIFALLFINSNGLIGFCYSVIISNCVRVALMIIPIHINLLKGGN